MGPAGFTLGPCKVCFDIVWNCNADENMIIIQTFDARPWVHDRGQVGHHPWVVPRRSLDSHWVFLDSTCMSRRVQAAICPRTLKASKVCNCIQKQAVDPIIDRWAKVCTRWATVCVWWDLFTFCHMFLWKLRFWKSKITIGDLVTSQNQVARNWCASAQRQHACMHLIISCTDPQLRNSPLTLCLEIF